MIGDVMESLLQSNAIKLTCFSLLPSRIKIGTRGLDFMALELFIASKVEGVFYLEATLSRSI